MPIIAEKDQAAIRKLFDESLVDPVQLVYFTIPKSLLFLPGRAACETCNDVQELVEEIGTLSDKISVQVHNLEKEPEVAKSFQVDRVPALILTKSDTARVRYFGAPAGYEFSTLISDIQQVSTGETSLSEDTRQVLGAITEPIHIQVFVTPT